MSTTTVHTDEYTIGEDPERLTIADGALVIGDTDTERIPRDTITDINLYTDRSLSGFTFIGNTFGFVGVLMAVLFVGAVSDGFTADPFTLGTLFSAILGFIGLVYYRRLDHDELAVLVVETANEKHRLVSPEAFDELAEIKERLTEPTDECQSVETSPVT